MQREGREDVDVRVLAGDAGRLVPWRNGGGTTRELALASAVDGRLVWRASVAIVSAPGPFSSFAGCTRWICVVEGAGMELDHGPPAPLVRLDPLRPQRFEGHRPTFARLRAGPVRDFNWIVQGASASRLELEPPGTLEPGVHCLFALAGATLALGDDRGAIVLEPAGALLIRVRTPLSLTRPAARGPILWAWTDAQAWT
jgi:environmental stress-induced protein Ves